MEKIINILVIILYVLGISISAQSDLKLESPIELSEKYTRYVQKLDSGFTNIDYQDFRFSYIESEQYLEAIDANEEMKRLALTFNFYFDEMSLKSKSPNYNFSTVNKNDRTLLIKNAEKLLTYDYTNQQTHQVLYKLYALVKEDNKSKKHKAIYLGLQNSLMNNKKEDGKTKNTAYRVINSFEVNRILFSHKYKSKIISRKFDINGGFFDVISFYDGKQINMVYIDISKIGEGYDYYKSKKGKKNETIKDKLTYTEYLQKLDSGITKIDFQDFRFSYLNSEEQYKAFINYEEVEKLNESLIKIYRFTKYTKPAIIDSLYYGATKLLSYNYTSLIGHEALAHICKIKDLKEKQKIHGDIHFGLMQSIGWNNKDDGKSCTNSFKVIKDEEYQLYLRSLYYDSYLEANQSIEIGNQLCSKLVFLGSNGMNKIHMDISLIWDNYKANKVR